MRSTIRAAIKTLLDTQVPSVLGATFAVPQDPQLVDFAPDQFPVAEIHYLRMPSVNLTNHEYENTFTFGVVVYLDMGNDTIGQAETKMDTVMDALVTLFATNQTLGGAVDVGLIPGASEPVVVSWKSKQLYATALTLQVRETVQTD